MNLRNLFETWGRTAQDDYMRRQWLLSKWEVFEGIEWPREKIAIMLKTIRAGLDLKRFHTLLDLGCGGGWIGKALKPFAATVVGLDFSFSMLAHARRYCPGQRLVCGNIGSLPFRDHASDRVLSYFVFLNFMEDRFIEQGIQEIMRVLKKEGRALIGQLPDGDRSKDYDRAKAEYLEYCRGVFELGKDHRDICRAPQKLFSRERLVEFLDREKIQHKFLDSFNPFYRPGQPAVIPWRFDLVLIKDR